MSSPIDGIRVLDLSRILSGPFCTMLLADLGAEVVKVEMPGQGDPARNVGPMVGYDSASFISVNRGKKSITLDLNSEDGQKIFRELIPHFDVLVENFVPGTMDKFGLDYQSVQKLNSSLVYLSISGFGQDGPYARMPAMDIVVQAMGGIMSVTGEPGKPPLRAGISLGDSVAGLFAALAVVSALYQRVSSGRGQHIDMSMLDCQVTMMENAFSRYFSTGEIPGPTGSSHPLAAPFQAFEASDGYFVVALLTDNQEIWGNFCSAIGRDDLGEDSRFIDNAKRVSNIEKLKNNLYKTFLEKSCVEWVDILSSARIPCGPINDIASVVTNPQLNYRSMFRTIPHKFAGEWEIANTPFRFSDSFTGPAGPSPALGEQNDELLGSLVGLSGEEIASLLERGVI